MKRADIHTEHINNLILSFLNRTISSTDLKVLKEWIDENEDNKAYFSEIQKIWLISSIYEKKNFDKLKDRAFQQFKDRIAQRNQEQDIDISRPNWNRIFYIAARFFHVAQVAAKNFSDGSLRKSLHEDNRARALVAGEARAAVFDDVVAGERRILLDDHGLDHFAHARIVDAHDAAFEHAGHGGDHAFDFIGIDVKAVHNDQVLLAVRDRDRAAFIHKAHVAGSEPAVDEDVGGLFGLFPVACHHLRALDADFARVFGDLFRVRTHAEIDELFAANGNERGGFSLSQTTKKE